MKKINYLLFGIMCLFSFSIVFAKNEIVIKSITPVYDKESSIIAEEKEGTQSVTFNDDGQTMKYEVVLENTTKENITVTDVKLTSPTEDFLIFDINDIAKDQVIKGKDTAKFVVTLETVKEEGWGRNFDDELVATVVFDSPVLNPETSTSSIITILLIIATAGLTFTLIIKNKKVSRYIVLVLLLGSSITIARALYTVTIEVKINAAYKSLNVMEKALADDKIEDESVGVDYWYYRQQIKNISIANEFSEIENYAHKFDVSEKKDNRVIAYLVENEDDANFYDLYIQADGIIYPNQNSTHYFYDMINLETINNLEGWDTSEVTDMSFMFHKTGYNTPDFTLDLGESFDTSSATTMHGMFSMTGFNSADFTLDLGENFDTSNVLDMYCMFNGTGQNSTVFTLDLKDKFNTEKVENMYGMFAATGATSPVFTLDLGDKFDTSSVTTTAFMFNLTGMSSTEFTLDLGDKFDTSNVTNMSSMFSHVGFNAANFTLELGDNFNTEKVTDMSYMFNAAGYFSNKFFIDLNDKFDTSSVTNMYGMFGKAGYMSPVFTLDLGENFNTQNVTDMSVMFNETGYNSEVFTLDLGDKFDTSNVTNMYFMFGYAGYACPVFTLDLGDNFNTEKVTDMSYMFNATGFSSSELTLNLGDKFDTSNVTNMFGMFATTGFSSPVFTLDLGDKFDTSKVTDMGYMFNGTGYSSPLVDATITIRNPNTAYTNIFALAFSTYGSKLTVNYTSETSALVDSMIRYQAQNANVVKGVQVD